MKTKLMVALFLTVLNTAVFSTERRDDDKNTRIRVEKMEDHIYNLVYSSADCRSVLVKIFNVDNELIFTDNIRKHDSFARPYNFSQLPEGKYTLTITDDNGTTTEIIDHKMDNARIVPSTLNYVNISMMPNLQDKYKLTIVNAQGSVADVTIIDNEDRVLYSSVENVEGNFAKLFDLTNVKGEVTFEVKVNGEKSLFHF